MSVHKESFGQLDDGTSVEKFILTNKNGMVVELIDYGATIVAIKVPNKDKSLTDVTLGFDNIGGYLSKSGKNPYFGALIGRVGNRIANGKFKIDGQEYTLAQNNGTNSLHGGLIGFDKVIWNASIGDDLEASVTFTNVSKDGHEGYPGDLVTNVTYVLTDDNGLELNMKAMTSTPTLVNLTNHVYFNLAGHDTGAQGLGQHLMSMNANHYLPTNDNQIPTGELADVGGTVFDLRVPSKPLSAMLPDCPGGANNGFDHNFCVNGDPNQFRMVCRVDHKESGRALECFSNQPGVQFYTGNFIPTDDSLTGKNGCFYKKHAGFCLETQQFPDAINQKFEHDGILRPGQIYDHKVMYKLFF